jgi:hypothetical protein
MGFGSSFTGPGVSGASGASIAALLASLPASAVLFNNAGQLAGASNFLFTGVHAQVPAGVASAPGLAFYNDTDTGIYAESSNRFCAAVNGQRALMVSASDVVLGYLATTGFSGGGQGEIAIGLSAATNGAGAIAIGTQANTSTYASSIALGAFTTVTGVSGMAIGRGAAAGAYEVVIGGNTPSGNDFRVNNLYLGGKAQATSPQSCTINLGGASGTDLAAGTLSIAGGRSTGNAVSGAVRIMTGAVGASGTAQQVLTERVRFWGDGGVGIGSLASSPGAGSVAVSGDIVIDTAGRGLKVREGANATMGTATLVAGTVTINTTKVTANSRIFLQAQDGVSGPNALRITARTAGASFTVTSSSAGDTSTIAWVIVEPA